MLLSSLIVTFSLTCHNRELGISGEENLEPQPTPTSTLFSVGDWVQFEPEWVTLSADIQHQSPNPVIGRVWAIRPDGTIDAAVVGRELLVKGFDPDDGDIEKCDGFREGQFVRPKPHIEASRRSRFVWAGWEEGRVHKAGWSMARWDGPTRNSHCSFAYLCFGFTMEIILAKFALKKIVDIF